MSLNVWPAHYNLDRFCGTIMMVLATMPLIREISARSARKIPIS